jgi:hypothetical protein
MPNHGLASSPHPLPVYCPDARLEPTVSSPLGSTPLRFYRGWDDFVQAASGTSVHLVVLPALTRTALRRLAALGTNGFRAPLVLVTVTDWENARELGGLVIDEVVGLSEVKDRLKAALQRAGEAGLRTRLAIGLEEAAHLPPRLRRVLSQACRLQQPPNSVTELARLNALSRATLWREWRRAGAPPNLRPQDFLGWLMLLRALACRSPANSWSRVAVGVGVHPHTLGNLCQRLTSAPLRQLAEEPQRLATAPRCRQLLEFLLGDRAETFFCQLQRFSVDESVTRQQCSPRQERPRSRSQLSVRLSQSRAVVSH